MNNFYIEPSPHIKSGTTTQKIMLNVIIALLPVAVMATIYYGIHTLLLILVCVASCVAFEALFTTITKRPRTIQDLSAVVTGLLLAYNLPPEFPIYMAVIGSFVAIVITKCFFGGIGQNFANPAIVGRIVLMLSFTAEMTTWTTPFFYNNAVDAVSTATPLAQQGGDVLQMLFMKSGCIGECCNLALIIGGLYLIATQIIFPLTPVIFIGTVALGTLIGGHDVAYGVLSGGLILGAFFMATDYSTTPITPKGKCIFAFGCGLITLLIRYFGVMPEGVSYSILLMNILTPWIDKATMHKPFGAKKEVRK